MMLETNELAISVNAHAFTFGHNIFLSKVESLFDKKLLAHELTHVVQQQRVDKGVESPIIQRKKYTKENIGKPPQFCQYVQREPKGERFYFKQSTDDFVENEEERLLSFINRILSYTPSAIIDIYGMASSEGDFNLNQALSCYRAHAAAFILENAGLVNNIRSIEALGEIYNTNKDPKFRAVDIDVMTPIPKPLPSHSPSPPNIGFINCNRDPFVEADIMAAAREAFITVYKMNCIKSDSLKNAILDEFYGLIINCEKGDVNSDCGSARPLFSQTVNIYSVALNSSKCGPLASTILHEVVHLTENRIFGGHGVLADACEKSCFGHGSGDASKCK